MGKVVIPLLTLTQSVNSYDHGDRVSYPSHCVSEKLSYLHKVTQPVRQS